LRILIQSTCAARSGGVVAAKVTLWGTFDVRVGEEKEMEIEVLDSERAMEGIASLRLNEEEAGTDEAERLSMRDVLVQ
jgi:hypothetical protein